MYRGLPTSHQTTGKTPDKRASLTSLSPLLKSSFSLSCSFSISGLIDIQNLKLPNKEHRTQNNLSVSLSLRLPFSHFPPPPFRPFASSPFILFTFAFSFYTSLPSPLSTHLSPLISPSPCLSVPSSLRPSLSSPFRPFPRSPNLSPSPLSPNYTKPAPQTT